MLFLGSFIFYWNSVCVGVRNRHAFSLRCGHRHRNGIFFTVGSLRSGLIKKSLATFHSLRSLPTVFSSLVPRSGTYLTQGSLPMCPGDNRYINKIEMCLKITD